jgi:hypothetical protein
VTEAEQIFLSSYPVKKRNYMLKFYVMKNDVEKIFKLKNKVLLHKFMLDKQL